MTPIPTEPELGLSARELADFYMKMYLENLTFARHHETQRSAATTMFFGFPVDVLTIGTAFARDDYPYFLALGLVVVAFGGIALSLKLFERSAFHMTLANAYRDSLEVLYQESARVLLPPDKLKEANYVASALREKNGFIRAGINYRQKKTITFVEAGEGNEAAGIRSLEELNPAAPFTWVDPLHNRFARYLGQEAARWDLYRIWAFLFAAVGLLGIIAFAYVSSNHLAELFVRLQR